MLDARIAKRSPYPQLDAIALAKLRTCDFFPAKRNGRLVKEWLEVHHEYETFPSHQTFLNQGTWIVGPLTKPLYLHGIAPPGFELRTDDIALDRSVGGWYILAGSTRSEDEAYSISRHLRRDSRRGKVVPITEAGVTTYYVLEGLWDRSASIWSVFFYGKTKGVVVRKLSEIQGKI